MVNFNKLHFIVYETFDNSQLFLTDPRICMYLSSSYKNTSNTVTTENKIE